MEFHPLPPDESLFKWRRAYAVRDSVQPDVPERGEDCRVYLDMVDADWIDDRDGVAPITEVDADNGHLSILAVEERYGEGPFTEADSEGETWWEIDLDHGEIRAQHFASLFHLPLERKAGYLGTLNREKTQRLARMTSLEEFDDATADEVRAVLNRIGGVDDVAVYDVGQGNANGLLRNGQPHAYFDLGGGVLFNVHTYPTSITFCFSASPCVVLSHWDWDHWASGKLHAAAQSLTWIVPRQTIGPRHRAFAALIAKRGTLLVWPPRSPSLSFGRVQIVSCTGTTRNDSGMAAFIDVGDGPGNDQSRPHVLLPADAAYKDIPLAFAKKLSGLAATHHGGKYSGGSIPSPAKIHSHKVAYSFGDSNTHGHPLPVSVTAHRGAGWTQRVDTAALGTVRGHVRLNGAPPRPAACRGKTCTLDLTK